MKYYHSQQYPIEFVISENLKKDFSSHSHANHYIISLCLRSSANVQLDNKNLCMAVNDFFVVPPFMSHAVTISESAILASLCMDKSFMKDYDLVQGTNIINKILKTMPIQKHITMEQQDLFLKALPGVYELQRTHSKESEDDIALLLDRLINPLNHHLTLEQLANEIYISKYHLIRKCKSTLGMTPHKFQMQNQIRKAQNMLLTGKSITEVSLSAGFYDQSHFDKYFRKIVGISPSEYLNSRKNIPD